MTEQPSSLPSFLEDHISQIPALQLLQNLGYVYLRPQETFLERKGKLSNVLLEGILEKQLRRLNRINFKGRETEFSDANIQSAIQALKDTPLADGLMAASEKVYDLLSLGKSLEQTIDGDTKSFTLNYVDWKRPENNVYHVAEEFEVETQGGKDRRKPDIVLFVNGIPFVVIECKRPDEKDAIKTAISQHLRNHHSDHIPRLFVYSQLVVAINKNEAKYATTGTKAEFWSEWKERGVEDEVSRLINRPLSREQKDNLFAGRAYVRRYFDELEAEERLPTEQDVALYCLCRPGRLIELTHQFIVFDGDVKKIARYQQYFAIKKTIDRIKRVDAEGRRAGGVIWHTQGSGKSLTMVMLAKAIALDPAIPDPRIVIITDRIDLDNQIWGTFASCGKEPVKATTGRHLLELLAQNRASIITTVIDKFETAVKASGYRNESGAIFALVDESHRSQYGEANARMQKVLPNACYIGFTGTPIKKKDKNTAAKFGGIIDAYTIDEAVRDRAVVPLLYEGRHIAQEVDRRAIDLWFERVTKPLTPDQRRDLKKKMSQPKHLNLADQRIQAVAWDISDHFRKNVAPPFKAQLATESKIAALKYKEFLDEFGLVTSEVLISGPDTREGNEAFERAGEGEVQAFWKRMMERYGNEKNYNERLIQSFLKSDDPKIIIVCDKLLTGFDAPNNTVLYLDKSLKEHALLQAIARVNRVAEGKEFGYIIDYYGVLSELSEALDLYGSLSEFDREDLGVALTDISAEIAKLPQRHSELWDVFKELGNKRDEESFERHLADEERRERLYQKFSAFNRTMSVAFSSVKFFNDTPLDVIERYKQDLRDFQRLRVSVKRRYAEEIDFREYEAKVQKLINSHVSAAETLQITPLLNIFNKEEFEAEVERLESLASRAETIANRTKKTITEKMDEDPFFYRRFSKILEDVIEQWREGRLTDAECLKQVTEIMNKVRDRTGDDLPPELEHHEVAKAFYGAVNDTFGRLKSPPPNARKIATEAALEIDRIMREHKVVDWISNPDVQNEIRNRIDDYLYELKEQREIDLDFDDMDSIVESSINIAKTRYV